MIEVSVYKPIDREDVFFNWMFGEEYAFSAGTIHKVFDENPDETEFRFNINCDGGSVNEGLRIYDVLRNSGKVIYTNAEHDCHSMAIILLLAAPKENRTANKNARALIHEVRTSYPEDLTANELRMLADAVELEQNAILDIYADRTGYDRAELEILMKEEKMRTAQELLKYGFISKLNTYSTNQTKKQMSKPTKTVQDLLNKAANFMAKAKNVLEGGEPTNYEHKDADGNVLFTTEKEDDSLAVGDAASPDGTFELPDGRTVVIAEGAITEITEPTENEATVEELQNRVDELENALSEANELVNSLSSQLRSTHNVAPRTAKPGAGSKKENNGQKTVEEIKNEAREAAAKKRGGK
jgi:ATP-dependent Clp protease protease subunit